ncbi:hypothetical protein [Nocardia terpenica]|uniref:hypothetical protein n=1 Tax=Nocardia terpenica TaxID=455432 RepID=UPI001E37793F|nr:hypothetical protein [Nocardia terpenica]
MGSTCHPPTSKTTETPTTRGSSVTALDDLQALLPPPARLRRTFDWTDTEHRLAVPALPDEFKHLLTAYGDVRFCQQLRLLHPYLDLAEVTLASRENLASDEFGETPTDVPDGVSVDPATLIQWGVSQGGDYCLWDAHDPDPDRWTLVFTDIDKLDWGYYDGTVTSFLLDWMLARTTPHPVWDLATTHMGPITPFCDFFDPDEPSGRTILDHVDATR